MTSTPNILLLQAEDIGRHLGCDGDPCAHTPYLDAFAEQSVRYTQGYSHTPVCAPSRGGMGLSRYPYSAGNHYMRSTLAETPRHFVQELKDAGYYVDWHTKLDFNFNPDDGWVHTTDAWVGHNAPEQPFFLYENFGYTHESTMFPDDLSHHQLPAEAVEHHQHNPEDMQVPPWLTDCPEVRHQLVKYYNALSAIDIQFGNRMKWLEEQGVADNTIVIFLSDHGRGLPREKRWCYDAGVHLPLMVRWPGHLDPGTVNEELVAWVDIAPTILSLCGVEIPESYQGQVFLGPDKAPEREVCFSGRDRMDEVFDCVRSVNDTQWRYIRNYCPKLPWAQIQNYMEQQDIMGVMRDRWRDKELSDAEMTFFQSEKPEEELYDVTVDPHCMNNLAGDPANAEVMERMRNHLKQHRNEVKDMANTTEEELVSNGVLTNRIPQYKDRYRQLPEEFIVGPDPMPLTLREAQKQGLVGDLV